MAAQRGDGTSGGIWRTSKWVRLNDWDWSSEPPLPKQQHFASGRAGQMPVRFFYHALRGRLLGNGDPSGHGLQIRWIMDTAPVGDLLRAFRTPMRFVDYLEEPTAHVSEAIRWFRTLRDEGSIVEADCDEPPDWQGVFAAGLLLYGDFQICEEIVGVLALLATRPPKVFVEIGTAWGGSLFCWAQVADPEAHLISIDLPGGLGGWGHTAHHARHFRQFCHETQRLSCVLGNSGDSKVLDEVRRLTDGETVDVLFIDGDHAHEAVNRDFDMYSPLVRPGGLIMFHDIMPAPNHATERVEVDILWAELRQRYAFEEFVQDPEQEGCGIGVLHV